MATEDPYTIRLARTTDLAELPEIERQAASLFRTVGFDAVASSATTPLAVLQDLQGVGRVWVAVTQPNRPVGFAAVVLVDDAPHLDELSVHPDHGRRGLGTRLLMAVVQWAGENGYRGITLSTFRHIPWNGPLYARHGFIALDDGDLAPELFRLRQAEAARGLPADQRTIMRRPI